MENRKLPHDHHSGIEKEFDHMPAPEAFEVTADLFKLMSDLTRVRLFWLLCHCEECVLNLSVMMNMSSPALSHHLKLLKACGLIVSRREGKEVYYKAADNEQASALHHVIVTLPYSMGGMVDTLHNNAQVKNVDYTADGIEIETVVDEILYGRLRDYIIEEL